MSELFLRVEETAIGKAFTPADDDTRVRLQRRRTGEILKGKFKTSRNYQHHKKYFAMLDQIFDLQEKYETKDELRRAVAVEAGEFVLVDALDGTYHKEAKSIAFDNMGQDDFDTFYKSSLDALARYAPVLCPANPDLFVDHVLSFL